MKKYNVILKYNDKNTQISATLGALALYNNEVVEILSFLKQNTDNFTNVLKQALAAKDTPLVNALVEALLNGKLTGNTPQLQQIITNNGYEVLILLASNGCTKIIYDFLKVLDKRHVKKTLILNLVQAAAVGYHKNTVKELMKTLFPK